MTKLDRRRQQVLKYLADPELAGLKVSWKDIHDDLFSGISWDLVRRVFKSLRDDGLITTGTEYTNIKLVSK